MKKANKTDVEDGDVVEQAYTQLLKSCDFGHAGSNPVVPTNCRKCGACCKLLVPLLPGEAGRIPKRYTELISWANDHTVFAMRQLDDGFCVAFDRCTRQCTIYAIRPAACREFPFSGEDMLCDSCRNREEFSR